MNIAVNKALRARELIESAVTWLADGRRIALVTLINIEGNAPYPVGTQMLVNDEGQYLGQITGGCAERAIADQAVMAIQRQTNQTHRYGLDSPFFDIQLPCGSGIDVFFDVQQTYANLSEILSQLEQRSAIRCTIASIEKVYQPTARLVLFGQGPILISLATLAVHSGFDVVCAVQTSESAKQLAEHEVVSVELQRAMPLVENCDEFSGVVSLFHEHDIENPILQKAIDSKAFYIGALGSKRTHQARRQWLLDNGGSTQACDRIHGPVGLDIAAITPPQIAIAILADIIAVMNNRDSF